MEKFVVTKEVISAARDYVTLGEKEAFVRNTAPLCIDELTVRSGDDPYPPYYHANATRVNRALMAALAGLYLRQSIELEVDEKNEGWLVSTEEYDRLAGSHVIGQLQRLKSDMLVRNKVFDLLSDYGELERMLKSEIEALIGPRNDTTVRMTENNIEAARRLPEIQKRLEDYLAEKKAAEGTESVVQYA